MNHYVFDLIIVLGLWAMPFVILAVWVWRDSRRDAEHIRPLTRSAQPPWDVGLEDCFSPPVGWPEHVPSPVVPLGSRREGGWAA